MQTHNAEAQSTGSTSWPQIVMCQTRTMDADSNLPPDTLNDIGVLKRREIEARIVAPLLERLGLPLH